MGYGVDMDISSRTEAGVTLVAGRTTSSMAMVSVDWCRLFKLSELLTFVLFVLIFNELM